MMRLRLLSGLAVLSVGAWACSKSSPGGPPVAQLNFPSGGPTAGSHQLMRAFPNLTFTFPVYLTSARDGTDRLFVLEKAGRICVFDNDPAVSSFSVFLDLTTQVLDVNEMGLLGLAFDPQFSSNGYFYVHYNTAGPDRSVISRFGLLSANQADPASETVLLEVNQPFQNHNAGMIEFGPDGMLYISFGDGGAGGDPLANGQNLDTLLGSMIRIDPNGGTPYAIPADNPFVGQPGVREEAWAYGFRNPWRFSFDRATGDLWLGDVGQQQREEVDLVVRGGNYGWRNYEGDVPFNNNPALDPADTVAPVIAYDRSQGASVIGGYVYRGSRLPELAGGYIYGDLNGPVWILMYRDGQIVSNQLLASTPGITSFGEDEAGEVYVVTTSGALFQLEPTGAPPQAFPTLLSETGIFADTAAMIPAPGVLAYDVIAPFWSDSAVKQRWLALPSYRSVGYSATDPWVFPIGAVLIKHFDIDLTEGNPATRRRLETRVLINEWNGWAGYTYRWNQAQTDATLLTQAETDSFTVQTLSGPRAQTWDFPSRTQCNSCHTAARGHVLGARAAQLSQARLEQWRGFGLFNATIGDPAAVTRYVDPHDPSQTIQDRARSYLAVNCAMCHLPGGPTGSSMDLRHRTAIGSMNVVDVAPTAGGLGLVNPAVVRAQSRTSSVLWERLRRLDGTRMPPLGSSVVDDRAVDLIGQWIDGL